MDPLPAPFGRCLLLIIALAAALSAQLPAPPANSAPEVPESPGSIDGTVLSDTSGQSLRRAQVLLSPVGTGGTALAQTTDDKGQFSFPKVTAGRYTITVQRDGYLRLQTGRIGPYKMPPVFYVQPGQAIKSFAFRMVPWGVLGGKIKFDDAEPAVNVNVQLYRKYYLRGVRGYAVAATTRTNDRGEYRVHGLDPGTYFVAALYQPPALPPGAEEQQRNDASGNPRPELSYAVTFFPQVQKLAEAVAVRVEAGQEVGGIDVFLTLVHTVRIRGRATSALSGKVVTGPSITLRWNDQDNTGSVTAPIDVRYDSHDNFEVRGVAPGPYLLIAQGSDDGKAITARLPIYVGEAGVVNLEILLGTENKWRGQVKVVGSESTKLPGLLVALNPRRTTSAPSRAQLSKDNEFVISYQPDETYDLDVINTPEDVYLKAVRVGNQDRLTMGLSASPGDIPPDLSVILSTMGGKVTGNVVTAVDPNMVASGASVMLIPDPVQGRVQAYKDTFADEYGNFVFKGVSPGRYLVLSWLSEPPCEVYNPDDFPACKARGTSVTVADGDLQTLSITAN